MGELRNWMSLLAAVGQLSLGVTALVWGRRSALARPLAGLCFVLFGWNFATLCNHVFEGDAFVALDSAFTALSPPLVLEVVLTFVGGTVAHSRARAAVWLAFGALAALSLGVPVFVPRAGIAWLDSASWAGTFLALWLPTMVLQTTLLVRHLRESSDSTEKARTRTVLAALAIGATFSTSDIAHGAGAPFAPYLGSIGTLIAAALLASCAMRFALFDRNVSARTTLYVVGMIGAFVVASLVLFRVLAGSIAAQVFASAMLMLLVVAVARELVIANAEARERSQRLAVLGRFSAQMAHDLRSPLAAMLGAVQVLEGIGDEPSVKERATRKELLDLTFAQARRMAAIVDSYDRMGRIELRKTLVRIDEVVLSVARAHGVDEKSITWGDGDAECEADRDLFESAIDNVVRNALEATHDRGDVRIETARGEGAVVVRVVDTGAGMDARQRQRAFDDFYTTKDTGSGLGLSFARRVMVAHGGDVTLKSDVGVGTTVELRLPVAASA
jgi:signal transduction histidine kinase